MKQQIQLCKKLKKSNRQKISIRMPYLTLLMQGQILLCFDCCLPSQWGSQAILLKEVFVFKDLILNPLRKLFFELLQKIKIYSSIPQKHDSIQDVLFIIKQKMNTKENTLKVNKIQSSKTPSFSTHSKRQIQMIQNEFQDLKNHKDHSVCESKKWQITSGVSLHWKGFQETEKTRNQLLLKDIQNNQNTIFSYIVQQWSNQQPRRVIYKWTRIPKKHKVNKNSKQHLLLEEQHIYRGEMSNYLKNGQGLYIVLQKYMDNSEKLTKIKGFWKDDVLEHGVFIDENGKQEIFTSNIVKPNYRSQKRLLTHQIDKNMTIEGIRKNNTRKLISIDTEKFVSPDSMGLSKN